MTTVSEEARGRHGVPTAEEDLDRYVSATTALLDAIDDVFYVCTTTGELLRWNERLSEVTGYSDDELGSMTIQECVTEVHVERVECALTGAIEEGATRWRAGIESDIEDSSTFEFTATPSTHGDDTTRIVGIGRRDAGATMVTLATQSPFQKGFDRLAFVRHEFYLQRSVGRAVCYGRFNSGGGGHSEKAGFVTKIRSGGETTRNWDTAVTSRPRGECQRWRRVALEEVLVIGRLVFSLLLMWQRPPFNWPGGRIKREIAFISR